MNNYPPPMGMPLHGMPPPHGMTPTPPPFAPSTPAPEQGEWKLARTEQGKEYYYHTITKKTRWDPPPGFFNENELALEGTNYMRHTTAEGKPYWADKTTRQTTWEMPESVAANLERIRRRRDQDQAPLTSPWKQPSDEHGPPRDNANRMVLPGHRERFMPGDRRDRDDRENGSFAGERAERQTFVPSNEPQFSTAQDAEAAFMKVLKQLKVQPDWSWAQTIRAGIKDPNWRAIPEPDKRLEAFKKYCDELRTQEKTKEQDRQKKLHSDFMAMLASHPEITHYTRWKTARPILEKETIFRSAKDDDERRQLFDEYITKLRRTNAENEIEDKKTALDELAKLLKDMELEPFTRWHEADMDLEKIMTSSGDKFQPLHRIDVLKTFQVHIRQLQRDHNDRVQAEHQAQRRIERKNRDAFKALLGELRRDGKLRYGTKWKEIHPQIVNDPRYTAMLGQDGSSPLDLFWDEIGEEETKFRALRRTALSVLEAQQYEVTTATPFDEFSGIVRSGSRTAGIDDHSMRSIYDYVIAKVKRREDEDRRNEENDERHAVEKLRSVIKYLEPPVTLADDWESVRPRIETTDEYRALKSDELRQSAFDRHYRRLKEKDLDRRDRPRREPRDRERDRDRERERDRERDRDRRERDRDREYRNGHSDTHRRHRTRTRSPENDPYAAERRQAQQDREARYRNNDTTGLSPQPPRRDRERDIDRYSRRGSGDHYGRERREREVERERLHVGRGDPLSRADPREQSVSELDYGDGTGRPAARRRRESDESSARRDNKRPRYSPRAERKSKTPVPESTQEAERALRSGSEEGEIEED
ncbi:hypothetical protein DM02DRAFT_617553 [Periconia macrospinosa]|uniref:U1 snRNP-associated protein Usp104 n=1 Tax=Periconia macrospinosa TaxID=97972 RepID=A0A2V1DCY2_9PLEO|nr:hypothetical protein DM02DRAFT_617553 [Periconia macrospinosa]